MKLFNIGGIAKTDSLLSIYILSTNILSTNIGGKKDKSWLEVCTKKKSFNKIKLEKKG